MAYRDKDNRKKKSWREIDRQKGGSRHADPRDDREMQKESKRQQSSAYHQYKRDLDKVFSGSDDVPEHLKAVVPTGENAGKLQKLGAIKRAKGERELAVAMTDYLKEFDDLPEDYDLLLAAVDYPDEPTQGKVLQTLQKMIGLQPIQHKKQFILKLESISMLADDDDLRELAEELVMELR